MCEIEIKDEFYIKNQCNTCLSLGRKLKPLGKYYDIYKKIVSDYPLYSNHLRPDNEDKDVAQVLLCWECESVLKKVQKFLEHVCKADELFRFGQIYLHISLSRLTTTLQDETHPSIIYINEGSIKTNEEIKLDLKRETHPEISDSENFYSVPDSEIKTEYIEHKNIKKTSKWALKRAQLNRKAKFKIIEYDSKCYKTVKMDDEEMGRVIRKVEKMERLKSNFSCRNCSRRFKKQSLLVKHEKECLEKSFNYVCDICKKSFVNKRHLSAHIQKHYDKFLCLMCSYVTYEEENMKTHAQKQHKTIIECTKCGLKFGNQRVFFKHHKIWHERFICDHCGVTFKMRYSIKDHIRKQHSPFECKPCNKRFARYGGLWLHNKTRHSASSAGAYCVECDKSYADEYRYKWHLNNSARHKQGQVKRRIPCPSCDKVYTKNIYMKNHYDMVHLKNYKNRCDECDKSFIRNADLVKHRQRVHEGILPPKNKICYMCGRGFTTRRILTNHLRTHTGERPFACACGAKFAQAAALTAHMRSRGHATQTSCSTLHREMD